MSRSATFLQFLDLSYSFSFWVFCLSNRWRRKWTQTTVTFVNESSESDNQVNTFSVIRENTIRNIGDALNPSTPRLPVIFVSLRARVRHSTPRSTVPLLRRAFGDADVWHRRVKRWIHYGHFPWRRGDRPILCLHRAHSRQLVGLPVGTAFWSVDRKLDFIGARGGI